MDEPTAISYPTITVDGVKYTAKLSKLAFYRLDKSGVDLRTLKTRLDTGTCAFSLIYDILAACTGVPAEVLVEKIPQEIASQVVIEAMGKVQPSGEQALREPATARPITQ